MATILTLTPVREGGIQSPILEYLTTANVSGDRIENPAYSPFSFTTDGISCTIELEENSTIYEATRKDNDPYHVQTSEGKTILTLRGVYFFTDIDAGSTRPNHESPFFPIDFWRKNQNKIQITSPVYLDIPEQGWTIDRFNRVYNQAPFLMEWDIYLSGGTRDISI